MSSSEEEDPYKRLLGTLGGSSIQAFSKRRKVDVVDSSQDEEASSEQDEQENSEVEQEFVEGEESDEEISEESQHEVAYEDASQSEVEEKDENGAESSKEEASGEEEEDEKEEDDEELSHEQVETFSESSSYSKRYSDRPEDELQSLIKNIPTLKKSTHKGPLGTYTGTASLPSQKETDLHPKLHPASLSSLSSSLLPHLLSYADLMFTGEALANQAELRHALAFHVVNHCLLSSATIAKHNQDIASNREASNDQGFTKPKVLVLLPFKNSCLEFVKAMIKALPERVWVGKKKKFFKEFGPNPDDSEPKNKPADWYKVFSGNIDEDFRIGIQLNSRNLKLYSGFYQSDIIIASPLGLRRIIGVEGQDKRDFDFLSSLEVLILDQAELFLMQNFDHLQIVFENLNLIPKVDRGADITRLRSWNLNEWAKYLRQTVIFCGQSEPELNALFSRTCSNVSGSVRIQPDLSPSIVDVVPKIKQIFQRVPSESFAQLVEAKLYFFSTKILPNLRATNPEGLLIFTSSYLEYVSLRNLLKKEEFPFQGLNEYSTEKEVSRARTKFYQGHVRTVLYTERSHFYNRFKLRGVKSLFFFSAPTHASFYPELMNLLGSDGTSTVLFSQWELLRLERIIGTKRAERLLGSDKSVHLFC